jgi:hypothetical protein
MYCDFDPDAIDRWYSFEGMEQLVNLRSLSIGGEGEILDTINFTPLASLSNLKHISFSGAVVRTYSFIGMERLVNIESLSIYGEGEVAATVDFTPLASLTKLNDIRFNKNITRLPDLTMLENIRYIGIGGATDADLESLEGIGAPNVEKIWIRSDKEIDSFAPLNNLLYLESLYIRAPGKNEYKIADMSNLPRLKRIELDMGNAKIDLQGIENMSELEYLVIRNDEPFNIEGIGKLMNLKDLSINIISPEPSLEFLRDMPNLMTLALRADYNREGFYSSSEAYQVLDMSPLATIRNLKRLDCYGFIIKNISALDGLEA